MNNIEKLSIYRYNYYGDDMKSRKLKKSFIIKIGIVLSCLLVIIGIIKYVNYKNSDEYKLKEIGYSDNQITEIIEINKHIDDILNMEKNDKIIDILKSTYYIDSNFFEYINYEKENSDKKISDIIAIVNVGSNKNWYEEPSTADVSKGITMLVNKFNKLPEDYNPEDIIPISNWYSYEGHSIKEEVNDHYISMWKAAKDAGLSLIVTSSYRTSEEQENQYRHYEINGGKEYADGYAARVGFSEHQTGLALDIVKPGSFDNDFHLTDEYKWLVENSYKYGFILRYPEGKENLTGYKYESWHYRYVGVDLAKKVYESGLTYDEYYAYYLK